MNAKQGSCADCLLAALNHKTMPLMTVHRTPSITDVFHTVNTSVIFLQRVGKGESFTSRCVPLCGQESLSVAVLRCRVISMTSSMLELSSTQLSSLIIQMAVSMEVFVTSVPSYRWNWNDLFQFPFLFLLNVPPSSERIG